MSLSMVFYLTKLLTVVKRVGQLLGTGCSN